MTRTSQGNRRFPLMTPEDPRGAPGKRKREKLAPKDTQGPWEAPGELKGFRRSQGDLRDTWGAPGTETLAVKTRGLPAGAWGAPGMYAQTLDVLKKGKVKQATTNRDPLGKSARAVAKGREDP